MKCFVIMPYGDHQSDPERARELDLLYEQIIRPAVEAVALPGEQAHVECHRGDKEPRPGEIITHIVENLVLSDIAIADLSGRNANVFYELGVRHSVNDNTILIAQSEDDVPFDLRGQRLLIYRKDFAGGLRLRDQISRAVADIVRAPTKIDNPVRRFLFDRERDRIEERGAPPGYDFLREVVSQMSSLRQEMKQQFEEFRFVMNAATAENTSVPADSEVGDGLAFLEGSWRASPSGSICIARRIGGEIVAPYRYGNTDEIGRHHNFRRIGDVLFARFEWLSTPGVNGYGVYQIESHDRLDGGWWYAGEVPHDIVSGRATIPENLPGMHALTFDRIELDVIPSWAEEYFRSAR